MKNIVKAAKDAAQAKREFERCPHCKALMDKVFEHAENHHKDVP